MQIDFHHTVTYVVARFAGFSHDQGKIIAHSAQYVDDSTETGFVRLDNGMRFYRQATAHPVYDPANMEDDVAAESWLPFHFLPGGPQESNFLDAYTASLVCRPNSPVAKRMIQFALADKGRKWELHRLGIAAHVFVDTFAHQGFVGLNDDANKASGFKDGDGNALTHMPSVVPPVGHGQAQTFPDMPYLVWSYKDGGGNLVTRNNPADFLEAAHELCRVFQTWLGKSDTGLAQSERDAIAQCFAEFKDADGGKRHAKWLAALAEDRFKFGAVTLDYDPKEWKSTALGRRDLIDLVKRESAYKDGFLDSNWKLFHNAARCQRHDVFVNVLPEFGVVEN